MKFFLEKRIVLENVINEINLINIDDKITYLKRNDGILAKGYLDLTCQYSSIGVLKIFNDKVEINKLILYENIDSNEINISMEDFDYFIKDNVIIFSFKMNIEGYKEVEKTFQSDIEEKMEIVSNLDVNYDDIKSIINNDEDIILIENNIDNNELDNKCLDINNEGDSIDFNINGNLSENNKKESFFNSIFKKEKKVKLYKYRVILENDSYEEIAKEYNINLYKLKEINNNINLKLGNIIKIPCKK